ncbi:MAG: hypothetical protein K8T91_05830 [Planctomycetes bacterium]|nr:hypothetical protein [Planctomycetota bacterium]
MTDRTKLAFDFFKHLSTLSTACILVVAALVEKVCNQPINQKDLLHVTIAFGIALTASLVVMICLMMIPDKWQENNKLHDMLAALLFMATALSVVSFLVGLDGASNLLSAQGVQKQADPPPPVPTPVDTPPPDPPNLPNLEPGGETSPSGESSPTQAPDRGRRPRGRGADER